MNSNKIKREQRIARINTGLDKQINESHLCPRVNEWPKWAQESLHNVHKDRKARFNLWLLLWANGISSDMAIEWVMYHHKMGFIYDQSAWNSIHDLAKRSLSAAGREYLNKFPVWNWYTNRVERH